MEKDSRLTAQRRLSRYKDALQRQLPMLRKQFHIRYLGLFGSYVQGIPGGTVTSISSLNFLKRPACSSSSNSKTISPHF
jgi:hypothetical protein